MDLKPEQIKAITPIFLSSVGAIIAIVVLVNPISDNKFQVGIGLATSLITGSFALAQPNKDNII